MSLPRPDTHCFDEDTKTDCWSYSKELVLSVMAEREAKITELETKLATLAALVAKKDEALRFYSDCNHFDNHSDGSISVADHGNVADKAIALTADNVGMVELEDYALVNGALPINTKLYTIKLKL